MGLRMPQLRRPALPRRDLQPLEERLRLAGAAVQERPHHEGRFRAYLAMLAKMGDGGNAFVAHLLRRLQQGSHVKVGDCRKLRSSQDRESLESFEERLQLSAQQNFDLIRFTRADAVSRSFGEAKLILDALLSTAGAFDATYQLLDRRSRDLMVDIWAYRILGFERIKLATNTPAYWEALRQSHNCVIDEGVLPAGIPDWRLDLFDLGPLGLNIKLYCMPMVVGVTILGDQYRYSDADLSIGVEPGDIVIDGGGCWGDTAVHFAEAVGPAGKIFSFEFVPGNGEIFDGTVSLNPTLAPRIERIPRALWSQSSRPLRYQSAGPGTHIAWDGRDSLDEAETQTIDDFVAANHLPCVNFIKLDIEGAELPALMGAEETIRQFKPRLAVSLYHRPDDMATIPHFLNDLGVGYAFRLGHSTIHREETVLFAKPV